MVGMALVITVLIPNYSNSFDWVYCYWQN